MKQKKLSGLPLKKKGYLPLPVDRKQKGCFIEGWPSLEWTGEAWGIGLNLVGLLMVDFDIDLPIPEDGDIDVVMELASMVSQTAPIRTRHDSTRCAMLLRCPELTELKYRRRTSKWDCGHAEVKGGRGHFLFGWGRHPDGAQLHWDYDDRILDEPKAFPRITELPIITRAEVETLVPLLDDAMTKRFGEPKEAGAGRGFSAGGLEHQFDLTSDMVFTTDEGARLTIDDLRAEVGGTGRTFVNLTPFRPNSDSMAGLVAYSKEHSCVRVTDLVEGVVHLEATVYATEDFDMGGLTIAPLPAPERARDLEAAQSEASDAQLARARALLFIETKNAYVWRHDPEAFEMAKGSLFTDQKPADRIEMLREIPFVNRQVWDPRKPPMSVVDNPQMGWREHNIFFRPQWPSGGELRTFFKWFERFIPDAEDREYVLRWMAAKAQYPWERCFAVALVGPQGSGKSTLWRLLQALWHPINVAMPGTMEDAFKGVYQDSLFRRLYTLFDEVASEDAGDDHASRRRATNALKAYVDTGASIKRLNIKYGRQQDVNVVSTIGVATNYPDALPLDRDDRRFMVVQTGTRLDRNPIPVWMADERNLGALLHHLTTYDLQGFDYRTPPVTAAKETMWETNQTELDEKMAVLLSLTVQSGGHIIRRQFDWYCDQAGIIGKQRAAAFKLYKRHFPQARTFKAMSYGTFQTRLADTVRKNLTGAQVLEQVNSLSDVLTRMFPSAENAPKLVK